MILSILLLYLLAINIYAYLLMWIDKGNARKQRRRIPEKTLFLVSAIGGAAGSLLGMRRFRHKTKHLSFTIGIPLLVLFNAASIAGVILLTGG